MERLRKGLQKYHYHRPKIDIHFVLINRGGIEVMNDAVSESSLIFVLLSVFVWWLDVSWTSLWGWILQIALGYDRCWSSSIFNLIPQ